VSSASVAHREPAANREQATRDGHDIALSVITTDRRAGGAPDGEVANRPRRGGGGHPIPVVVREQLIEGRRAKLT
jgi:hypothetical protein